MVLTPHILAGAVVAAKINNPAIGLPLAFFSHFVLDALPHREYSIKGLAEPGSKNFPRSALKILIDISLGLAFVIFGAPPQINFPYLAGAVFLAVLPDFFQLLTIFNPRWLKKFNRWHGDIVHIKYPLPEKWRLHKPKIRPDFIGTDWKWIFQIVFSAGLFVILIWP